MAYDPTVDQIARALGGESFAGDDAWRCRCPCHEDNKASLWIKQANGGGLHVKCFAGCASDNIKDKLLGMKLWPKPGYRKPDNKDYKRMEKRYSQVESIVVPVPDDAPVIDFVKLMKSEPTVIYEYKTVDGELVNYVARWDSLTGGKNIRPFSLAKLVSGRLEWISKAPAPPYSLYNLEKLARRADAPVLIVEGEKAADSAEREFPDYVVITWRMGAGSTGKSDFSPLAGRQVTLWPDADEPGVKAMAEVAAILQKIKVTAVKMVTPPSDVEKGWDAADLAPSGVDKRHLLDSAAPFTMVAPKSDEVATATSASQGLRPYVLSAAQLSALDIPPREMIVEPFLPTSSLAMIYAPRGLGKTWVCLSMAVCIAEGSSFLGFDVPSRRSVLYIDGEMAVGELQQRIRQLAPTPPDNFFILPSEILFREAKPLNLHDLEAQKAVDTVLEALAAEGNKIEVIVLDNLSSLSGGVDENDNTALDTLLNWFVGLRHKGLAVVMVHHAGKSGTQRGASRREDFLDTSISLTAPKEEEGPKHTGAHVIFAFAKLRGKRPSREELDLKLVENRDRLEWAFAEKVEVDRATEILRILWEKQPKTQSELAKLAGVKDAAISLQMTKLKKDGYADNNPLSITSLGLRRLCDVWPELEAKMRSQGKPPAPDDVL